MVLLHVLHELAPRHGWQLTIAHLNHTLRGRSSDADERLLRRTAARLKVPVRVGRADVRGYTRARGLSLEMAARKLRHEFLARTAAQLGSPTVALAHHSDDQLELFFLRLLRGASGEGLAGMKWRGPSPANRAIELVRPLLDCTRAAILEHAAEARIPFREDASNASKDMLRNRIRLELLPLLRRNYQPALARIILRTADVLGAEAEFAATAAAAWIQNAQRGNRSRPRRERPPASRNGALPMARTPFDDLPVAVQRRVIQNQLLGHGVVPDYSLIEELRLSAERQVTVRCVQQWGEEPSGAEERPVQEVASGGGVPSAPSADRLRITPGLTVARDHKGILHLRKPARGFNPESLRIALDRQPGTARFGGAVLRWRIHRQPRAGRLPPALAGRECFDADKVGPSILLRHWQPGDRFQPIGMARAVKLQDFFTNQKVPQARRRDLIVAATAAGEVFWVEGLRIGEPFKLAKSTIHRLQWYWRRI